jgi:hypothetical protein
MAIRRSGHWVSQLRVDVSDMRSIESAVRSDFDEAVEALVTGENLGYVIRGFELNMVGAVGNSANGLSVIVSDSAILHTTSLVSGTIFKVAAGTPVEILSSTINNKVIGSFAPSSTNYVSIDFNRAADASTQAPRAIWDPTNKIETSKVLPVAQLMTYIFKVTTTGFAADTLPLAIVQTDAANNVTSITDRRPMLFRLGTAGFSAPNPSYAYPWTNQPEGRTENPPTSTSSQNPFHGGDKQIKSQKEWMDAVMSIIQEITGGIYWYSLGTGGSISGIRSDGVNTVVTGRATIVHDDLVPGKLNWDFPLRNRVIGSRLTYTISAYAAGTDVTLADGQVAYINLVRDQVVIPALIFTNGSAIVNSVGAIAWTVDLVAGDYIKIDGIGDEGYYEILSVDSASQVTLTTPYAGASTGPSGINAKYAFGVYNVVGAPSTDRHLRFALREETPITADMYWFYFRDDNGGSVPKIYTRFKSGELEQGESQQVSDNTSLELLQFIGSTSEADNSPQFASNNYVTDGDPLTTAISDLDAAAGAFAAADRQDRSSKVIEGGTWSLVDNAGTYELTLSANAYVQIPGLTNVRNTILAQTIMLPNASSVAYVELVRTAGVATNLTVNVADVDAVVATDNTVIIARRVSTGVTVGMKSFLIKPGEYLELDGALAEINRRLTQLKLHKHASNVSKATILGADFTQLDQDILSQVVGEFILSFTGAVINFSTGAILKEDDVTALGINFTPFTIPVGHYYWYGVSLIPGNVLADNRQEAQVQIDFGDSANAVQASAPLPVITGDIKLGAIQVQNIAGTITVVQTRRLGVGSGSGGGSGDASSLDTLLRDRFAVNSFELMDQNIFRRDKATKIDVVSTGAYSPAKRTFAWTAIGQTMVSQDVLDQSFLDEGVDITEAELYLNYLTGFVDAAATYEISRDGGTNWQTMTMEQIGLNAFRGYHVFSEEVSNQALQTVAASGAGQALNATTQQELSSQLALSTTSVVKTVDLNLNYGGVGTGLVTLRLVKNNAGVPSTAVADILSESDAKIISAASLGGTGDITVTFDLPDVVLTAGTYHLVLVTDAGYKAGTLDLSWRNGAGTNGATFDGSVWTGAASTKAAVVSGRAHDLIIRVTSSVALAHAEGYGLYYGLTNGVTSVTGEKRFQKFYFTGDENKTDFLLTFTPDPELLDILDPYRGQMYAIEEGVARIEGQTVKFEPDTFDFPGEDIVLIFRQTKASVIDNSDSNAAAISEIQSNLIDIGDELASISDSMILPKIVVPNTAIQNRAQIPDLSQDLKPRFAVDRIMTQQIYQLQDEFGPNGEQVFGAVNDKFNQIRFVGNWINSSDTTGVRPLSTTVGAYVEITFYGTGLNFITALGNDVRSNIANVDGGADSANLLPGATASVVLNVRNYNPNNIIPVASGLTLGIHTIKIRNDNVTGGINIYGFEVLNENTSGLIQLPPGAQLYKGKKRTHTILETTAYNSGFETGTLGTRGGRVLVYQKADGSVAKAVTPTDASQLNLASANHSNEEIARIYFPREFGAGRADDFSRFGSTPTTPVFTLDDGSTTLIATSSIINSLNGIEGVGWAGVVPQTITFTFVGTGIDIETSGSALVGTVQYSIDGSTPATITNLTPTGIANTKIASGLPYGTHTLRLTLSAYTSGSFYFTKFIVYQPKTPTLPNGAVEIGAYNILANFAPNSTAGISTISTGTLRKFATREFTYVNGTGGTVDWSIPGVTPANNICGFEISSNRLNAYIEYTFYGTGFDFRFMGDTNSSNNITVTVDGLTFNTTNYPSQAAAATVYGGGITFTSATGILDQQATVSVTPGCGFVVTGLALGKHTIRFNNGTANLKIENECLDIITPIHSHQDNGPFVLQNTLAVGSQGVADFRKFSKKDVNQPNVLGNAVGISGNTSTTSTTAVPLSELSLTIKTTKSIIELSTSGQHNNNTTGNGNEFFIYVDGKMVTPVASAYTGSAVASASFTILYRLQVSPGYHKIDVYWRVSAATGLVANNRILSVRELD